MRKVEQLMLEAIRDNRNFSSKNTKVRNRHGVSYVYLFKHRIAIISSNKRKFNMCGWNTVTTRSRLNALGAGITQHRHVPFFNGKVLCAHSWYEF